MLDADRTERLLAQLSDFESSHGLPGPLGALPLAGRGASIALATAGAFVVLLLVTASLAIAGALL